MSAGIYKLTSPSGKCYIGQSMKLEQRFRDYRCLHCKNQNKLYNAILKYGWENFDIEILYQTSGCFAFTRNVLNSIEIKYIKIFQSNITGYNIEAGGYGGSPSDATKLKISKANKGRKMSPEFRERCRLTHLGRVPTDEARINMRNAQLGRKHSEETKAKMSIKSKGRIQTQESKMKISEANKNPNKETREKMAKARYKAIVQYTLDGEFIREWDSAIIAARELGLKNDQITRCCTGINKTSYGFIWKHKI